MSSSPTIPLVAMATRITFMSVRRPPPPFTWPALRPQRASRQQGGWRGPEKLYYTAFDKRLLKLITRIMPLLGHDPRAIGRNKDIDLVEIAHLGDADPRAIDVDCCLAAKAGGQPSPCQSVQWGPGFYRFLPGRSYANAFSVPRPSRVPSQRS